MVIIMKKDELITRRELFRKCAKTVLTTIAVLAINNPVVAALKDVQAQDCKGACMIGCNNTCHGSCAVGCTHLCENSCTNLCKGTCSYSCQIYCKTTCGNACDGKCTGLCQGTCKHSSTLTTKNDTIIIKDSIK